MGYDLTSKESGDYFRFNIHGWGPVLSLARKYGWQPMGTIHESSKDWEGSYFGNDCQVVVAEDAANIAIALQNAMPYLKVVELTPFIITYSDKIPEKRDFSGLRKHNEIPEDLKDEDVIVQLYGHEDGQWYPGKEGVPTPHILCVPPDAMLLYKQAERDNPETYWSGIDGRDYIYKFIEFCNKGAFEIC